jgi:hypothetical protein
MADVNSQQWMSIANSCYYFSSLRLLGERPSYSSMVAFGMGMGANAPAFHRQTGNIGGPRLKGICGATQRTSRS